MISKRAAVQALCEINEALRGKDSPYFYGYVDGSAGEYDGSVYSMTRDIKDLKREVEEYRALKRALEPIIKRR
jgi:hypothetical protein